MKTIKSSIKFLSCILIILLLNIPASKAQRVFHNTVDLNAYGAVGTDVELTADGGYIIAGSGGWINDFGSALIKINSAGDTMWTEIFGDTIYSFEECWSVKQTSDGGFIMGGASSNAGQSSFLRKIDSTGNVLWKKSFYYSSGYGGFCYGVVQTADSGFVFIDDDNFYNGFLSKTDKNGNILWSKNYTNAVALNSVVQTSDNGFLVSGKAYDTTYTSIIVIKTDSDGNEQWINFYGSASSEGRYAEQTDDGGYIVTGVSAIAAGDSSHIFLLKTDASGIVQWSKLFYSPHAEAGNEVHQTGDGGFIITGASDIDGTDYRLFLLKTNSTGVLQWQKLYGPIEGSGSFKFPCSMKIANDGGYVCSAYSLQQNYWGTYIIKTDSAGNYNCGVSLPSFNQMNAGFTARAATGITSVTADTLTLNPQDIGRGGNTYNLCLDPTIGLHHFWVTAGYGGGLGNGTILKSDSTGNQFTKVVDFHITDGSYPAGNIVIAGDGKLYGICEHGGVGNSCTLYSVDTSTFYMTKLHDFDLSYSDGDIPFGGLIEGSDCKLYGNTNAGGADSGGVIYSFDPSTNIYTDIYDFTDSTGKWPIAELTQLSDGKLYGITSAYGRNLGGTIYRFDPVSHVYEDLFDLGDSTGYDSWNSKLIQAPDGNLYGTTTHGGPSTDGGVLFRFDPVGRIYTVLHNFDYYNGGSPNGKVAYTNGKIYGMTRAYTGAYGMIFSYDLSADTFVDVMDFNGINGANPWRGLNLSTYGTLFGTTAEGGAYNNGVVFSFDPATNTYTKLLDFENSTTGRGPDCDVMEIGATSNPCLILSTPKKDVVPDFSVFPNPANGSFTISLNESNKTEYGMLTIYNLLGCQVAKQVINRHSTTIDCKNFSSGIYFVKISDVEKVFTQRLVIE